MGYCGSNMKGDTPVSMIEKVLAVQEHDLAIRDVEREMLDIPARKQAEQDRLKEHTQEVADAEAALKQRQAEIKQLELDVQSRRETINKLRGQQMQLKTNKEFKAMESEIEAVQAQIRALEDGELDIMESVEAARNALAEKQRALKEEESSVAEDVRLLDERVGGLATRLAEERAKREIVAADVDPEWLARYEPIAARRGAAVVAVAGNVCGGCHMTVPPSVVHASRARNEMVSCPHCGSLLY